MKLKAFIVCVMVHLVASPGWTHWKQIEQCEKNENIITKSSVLICPADKTSRVVEAWTENPQKVVFVLDLDKTLFPAEADSKEYALFDGSLPKALQIAQAQEAKVIVLTARRYSEAGFNRLQAYFKKYSIGLDDVLQTNPEQTVQQFGGMSTKDLYGEPVELSYQYREGILFSQNVDCRESVKPNCLDQFLTYSQDSKGSSFVGEDTQIVFFDDERRHIKGFLEYSFPESIKIQKIRVTIPTNHWTYDSCEDNSESESEPE